MNGKQVTPETLAAALTSMSSVPVWREYPDKGNQSVVTVKPDYKATAAAIYAALPDQPDALREALERLVAAVGKAQGRPPTGATNSPNPWAAVADAMRAARAALATSAAAGEGGDG